MNRNRWALISLLAIVIGIPLAALLYQKVVRSQVDPGRVVEILAAAPERGGFSPEVIRAEVDETLTLRFYVEDVTHGIAIGPGLGIDTGHIDPGHTDEVTLTLGTPGTFTIYCNTWCSPDHWRMRATLEVVDLDGSLPAGDGGLDPLIESIDRAHLDHPPEPAPPGIDPDAGHGAGLVGSLTLPPELTHPDWRLRNSPAQGLQALQAANPDRPETDLVDVIAHLWSPEQPNPEFADLFAKNCSGCHGPVGEGNGPGAATTVEEPVSFPEAAWERAGVVWYAKIRRGGMGTDMPNFGTVFTREETLDLVEYLRYLAFRE